MWQIKKKIYVYITACLLNACSSKLCGTPIGLSQTHCTIHTQPKQADSVHVGCKIAGGNLVKEGGKSWALIPCHDTWNREGKKREPLPIYTPLDSEERGGSWKEKRKEKNREVAARRRKEGSPSPARDTAGDLLATKLSPIIYGSRQTCSIV